PWSTVTRLRLPTVRRARGRRRGTSTASMYRRRSVLGCASLTEPAAGDSEAARQATELYAGMVVGSDIAFAALERDSGERFQSLRRKLGVRSFGMNLIVLLPGQRGRIHAHEEQEEVYLVLEGELTLLHEGAEYVLGPER